MKKTTFNCDLCSKDFQPDQSYSAFVFTVFGMNPQTKQFIPQAHQEDFCSDCTGKIKTALSIIKKDVVTKREENKIV